MGISNDQYRACIGMFNRFKFSSHIMISLCFSLIYTMLWLIICFLFFFKHLLILSICIPFGSYNTTIFTFQMSYYLLYTKLLLLMSGDIETNPGPIGSIIRSFSVIGTLTVFLLIILLKLCSYQHILQLIHSILCVHQKPT